MIGAALIGPTVKGPPLIPTVVNSYSEFEQIFGSTVKSGSNSFSYLTSLTARQYLKNQGALTVVRIMAGTYSQAFALVPTGSGGSGTGSSQQAASAGTPGEPFTVGANTENIDSDSAFEDTADATPYAGTGGGTYSTADDTTITIVYREDFDGLSCGTEGVSTIQLTKQ